MSDQPILVTGATGKQGGATARKLLAEGIPVRALVRDPNSAAARALAAAGADLATGDFDAPESLRQALADTRAVFLIPPPTFTAAKADDDLEAQRGIATVEAAERAGVEQIVFSGVARLGKRATYHRDGKVRIEEAVAASGLHYTLLRPARFMENFLFGYTHVVDGITNGVNRHLYPADVPLKSVAVADIAAIAALAFADPVEFHGRTLDLAGDAITPTAAAAAISVATGREVRYHELTLAEAEALGPNLVEIWRVIREFGNWQADIPTVRQIHPDLMNLDTWLSTTGATALRAQFDAEAASTPRVP
ncbi:NAD-dependent epimerase/dehydratase family protein [Nocardia panacis]|uniref:NAD-dependent epimerase/dehydratase family protein n=1 Tax=Nocardia panacis TaxID=2340916 RepID=A0A3A4KJ52_9NOCA|nr:NmrA family NAD(P)-binding protein [Nocardia panacis]RJO74912.1 NAD-dependent epimerase/dehydratase family protein [Nocardia panacis]